MEAYAKGKNKVFQEKRKRFWQSCMRCWNGSMCPPVHLCAWWCGTVLRVFSCWNENVEHWTAECDFLFFFFKFFWNCLAAADCVLRAQWKKKCVGQWWSQKGQSKPGELTLFSSVQVHARWALNQSQKRERWREIMWTPPSVLELTLGAFPDVLMQFLTKPRDFAQFCITL